MGSLEPPKVDISIIPPLYPESPIFQLQTVTLQGCVMVFLARVNGEQVTKSTWGDWVYAMVRGRRKCGRKGPSDTHASALPVVASQHKALPLRPSSFALPHPPHRLTISPRPSRDDSLSGSDSPSISLWTSQRRSRTGCRAVTWSCTSSEPSS